MILIPLLLLLSIILPAIATPGARGYDNHREHHPKCICDEDAAEITNNWITIRSTNPATPAYTALVDATFTDDVTIEDSTISFFFFNDLDPYSAGKQQLISNFNFSWTTATTTPLIPAPEIPIRHDCNSITFRWVVSATVNLVVPGRSAKLGDPLHYAGTDILILAPGTRLIQHVYTSADYVRLIWQEGTKLCYQRGAPKPVCADPPPPVCSSPLCE